MNTGVMLKYHITDDCPDSVLSRALIEKWSLKKKKKKTKKKNERKLGHPIRIPYEAKWKFSESNDTVLVQHFYLQNWQACLG